MRPVIYISAAFLLTGCRAAATSASVVATMFSSMATARQEANFHLLTGISAQLQNVMTKQDQLMNQLQNIVSTVHTIQERLAREEPSRWNRVPDPSTPRPAFLRSHADVQALAEHHAETAESAESELRAKRVRCALRLEELHSEVQDAAAAAISADDELTLAGKNLSRWKKQQEASEQTEMQKSKNPRWRLDTLVPPVDTPKPAEFLAQDRDRKCEHVDCYFTVHSDPTVSKNFCCKKCKSEFDQEPRGVPCHGWKCEKNDFKAQYASAGPKVPFAPEPGSVDAALSSPTIPTVSTHGLNIADRTNAAGNTASSSSGLKREDEGSPKRDDKDGEDIVFDDSMPPSKKLR